MNPEFWRGKEVLITGHTGFKGSWLSLWLSELGAKVHGYALRPPTKPSLFEIARVQSVLASHTLGDVRDLSAVKQMVAKAKPEIIFHLAAQSLVRDSYTKPVETYATNVMGTVHVLEAARLAESVKAIVNVTTDKCYENLGLEKSYSESDPMGGHDPYSNSKGCSELVSSAYRRSFLIDTGIQLATARAGNVLGGGDWAKDRLVPDFLQAWDNHQPLQVRSPKSTRPWQHVLEPLSGYLLLAQKLRTDGQKFASGWNFGPVDADSMPVEWIVDKLCEICPAATWSALPSDRLHEALFLKLNSSKAHEELNWRPRWSLTSALEKTVHWHQAWKQGTDMRNFSCAQIKAYASARLPGE